MPRMSQFASVTGGEPTAAPKLRRTVPLLVGATPLSQLLVVLQLPSGLGMRMLPPVHVTGAGTGTISPEARRAAPCEKPVKWMAFKKSAFGAEGMKILSSVP